MSQKANRQTPAKQMADEAVNSNESGGGINILNRLLRRDPPPVTIEQDAIAHPTIAHPTIAHPTIVRDTIEPAAIESPAIAHPATIEPFQPEPSHGATV